MIENAFIIESRVYMYRLVCKHFSKSKTCRSLSYQRSPIPYSYQPNSTLDILLQNWRGRQTAFDVAVTSPLSRSALPQSFKTAGAALASMKANKTNKHTRACQANGIAFVPLVVETLGGWETDALSHLRAIAKQTAARSASQAPIAIRQFFQRLSVLLQRANAALIASRAPAQAPPHILGL